MDVFLRDRDDATKVKVFKEAVKRAKELNLSENIGKLEELINKYQKVAPPRNPVVPPVIPGPGSSTI